MNQSVIKALKLLEFFSEDEPELSLREIAKRSGLPKPTAYRLLSSLNTCGFLMKTKESEHESKYRLGLKLLELGSLVSDQLELRTIAKPYMEELGRIINEAVHIVIVNNEHAIYIDKVESNRALRLYTKVGKTSPLYIGSGPKLLLAYMSEEERNHILSQPLKSMIDGKTIDKNELIEELNDIRKNGYSLSVSEQDLNTTGVSYPIFDHRRHVVASLTVSGLSSYFENDNLKYIKEQTKATAEKISSALGYIE
ncbi:IclR family transcriptional regulator [Bacillaceae bacterium W0354]